MSMPKSIKTRIFSITNLDNADEKIKTLDEEMRQKGYLHDGVAYHAPQYGAGYHLFIVRYIENRV